MTRADVVAELVAESEWRRLARANSRTEDDASEALQGAAEIALQKLPTLDRAEAARWFNVVLRHECWRIGSESARCLPSSRLPGMSDSIRPLDEVPGPERLGPRLELRELLDAIANLLPGERLALADSMLGFSYGEIAERRGWTRTKVNRCINEGRPKLRAALGVSV